MLEKMISRTNTILQKLKLKKSEKIGFGRVELNKKQRIFGYSKYFSGRQPKKALFCYLTKPIIDDLSGIKTNQFSNAGAVRSIAKVLNQTGYIVDIINWDDVDFIPSQNYDLYFLHGGSVYSKIKDKIPKTAKIIYYSTGSYWRYHNNQELSRFKDFNQRHNFLLKPDRFIENSEEDVNRAADLIISLGNKDAAKTYQKFKNVVNLEAANIVDDKIIRRDYTIAKNHFLFLAGPGNIHKGLDLLLDVFLELPNQHLHILCTLDNDFEQFYHDALYKTANIHTYGYIPQRSRQFYSIVKQCSASILPSCSEGSPGSVIESMQQGLIPIVSRESHVSVSRAGIILKDCKIETIKNQIQQISKLKDNQLRMKSNIVRQFVLKNFTVEKYELKLSKFILDLEGKL